MGWFLGACLLLASVSSIRTIPFDDRLFGAELNVDNDEIYNEEDKMTKFSLPETVKPTRYSVQVAPDLKAAKFTGQVNISVEVSVSTSQIVLNAKYIHLEELAKQPIRVIQISTRLSPRPIPVTNFKLDKVNEQLIIDVNPSLGAGFNYVVIINYHGHLGKDMMGFYLSKYKSSTGEEKLLASTQFEPTGARRAFPCFDEPKYKTPFTIRIVRSKSFKSISNLPTSHIEYDTDNPDIEIEEFKESPPMPTYLVGFAVFTFSSIENNDKDRKLRVWGREDVVKDQGKYILEKGEKILKKLGEYMDMDYYKVLPKMDLVAVPDFDAGAMENWGMNTYREKFILNAERKSTTKDFQQSTTVVTHEFTHQWFGDLVTPTLWNYAWLNEAFARFFQYFGTFLVEPTWRMEDLFVVEQVQVAFNSDLKGAHAMTSETTTPDSIAATFDHIIYNKGGSVLRMIENAVTPDVFKKSLQLYLTIGSEDLHGKVDPDNLWAAFDEVITSTSTELPMTIQEFTHDWVNKPGFPLVTFTRNYTNNFVLITQQRFLPKAADREVDKTRWNIPITYTTKTESKFSPRQNLFWLPKDDTPVSISLPKADDWFIANLKEVGYFRVNYDSQNWKLLSAQLLADPSKIDTINRAQILDDAFTLAKADIIPYQTALELSFYLHKEEDYIPWYSVWSHIRYVLHINDGTELANVMRTYFIGKLEPIYKRVDWEDRTDESNIDKIARSSLLLWFCNLGHKGCESQAINLFRQWLPTPEKALFSPNVKDAVYCMGIKHGSKQDWDNLWNYYVKTDLASEKVALLYALGCSTDETKLLSFLSEIINPKSEVRTQDHYLVVRSVLGEKAGVSAGLTFLQNQISKMLEEVETDAQSPAEDNLKTVISTLGAAITTSEDLKKFTTVLEPYKTNVHIQQTINKTTTYINERLEVRKTNQKEFEDWFNVHTPSTTPSSITIPPTSPAPVTNKPYSAAPFTHSSFLLVTVTFCFAVFKRQG